MKRTHGMSAGKSIYRIWANIKSRCTNPNHPRYKDYGGRGITLCERWRSFTCFYSDVGDHPIGLTLDRVDNNGGYEPNNVRWVTKADNNRNSRRCVMVELNGTSKPINVWCREFGVPYTTFKQRRSRGWDLVRAVSTPPDQKRKRKTAPSGVSLYVPAA